ncbi:DUF6082 family protein [Streptomyces sp. NPDC086549]|uniref:DUF6082 family protein n=1 Tax=Streptomyces sp. NPDC086549 TaxID=3365752 RepID=UPI0038263769
MERLVWTALAGVLILGLILATPFILMALGPQDADWAKLSQISQAYGALSVILSAGALVGVAASLAYQARQTRIATEETTWTAHRELLLLSLAETEFLACWEPPSIAVSLEEWRRVVYANLIIQDWEKSFRFGLINDDQLARTFEMHFRGQIARDHWRNSRTFYLSHAVSGGDRRLRRLAELADRAYEAATAAGPPVPSADYFVRPGEPGQSASAV